MWDKILQYLNDNNDALGWLFGSGVVLAAVGGIYRFIIWLLKEYRLRKIRTNDNFPFKVIPPNSNVAKEILGGADDDPLTDRNIPYQQRIQGRNTRRELEELIEDHRWIVLVGRTGFGKTREAVQLAKSLNNEGWTILYLTREAWLDAPAKLPTNIPERKLLFFIDDLNKKCYSSKVEIRPYASESLTLPISEPFQTRLQRTLEAFDAFCGMSEIRVIGTARNETTSEFDEPAEWDKLGWTKYNSLWKKFKIADLPEPDDNAEQKFLSEAAEKANITITSDELVIFAKQNDGTFRNLVENLSVAKTNGITLSSEIFRDTLKGTWQRRYQKAIQEDSRAKYIYDAIELLRDSRVKIRYSSVIQVAQKISNEKLLQLIKSRWEYHSILQKLIKNENILQPRDGQIEAKGYRLPINRYVQFLYKQIYLDWRAFPRLNDLSLDLLPNSIFDPAKKINHIEKNLILGLGLNSLIHRIGIAYSNHDFDVLTESIFRKTLELYNATRLHRILYKNRIAETCSKLGDIYIELGRSDDAIESYQLAIETDPKYSFSWGGRASVYRCWGFRDEAIAVIKKGIELNPKSADLWNGLGNVCYDNGQYEDALQAYNKAIQFNPKSALYWGNVGTLYQINQKISDAKEAYKKSLELNPKYVYSILSLAVCYKKTGDILEAEKLLTGIESLLTDQIDYVQACYQVAKGNIEDGLLLLKKGLNKQDTSKAWAQKDPNFEVVNDNPLFKEIIGLE